MKITKRGKPPEETIWHGRCSACKSEAEATQNEMNHITFDQREDSSFSWEICPVCRCGDKISGYGGMIFYKGK